MRTALPFFAFLALATPIAACGAHVTVDGTTTTSGTGGGTGGTGAVSGTSGIGGGPTEVHVGTFHTDCAPNDGPATLFIFDDLSTCDPFNGQAPLTEITVFGSQLANLANGGTVTVNGDVNGGAQGTKLDVGPGGSTSATTVTSGTLQLNSFVAQKSAAGVYDLTFADGTHSAGAFTVQWCPGGGQCG